jgi:hypothetical protein
MAYTLKQLFQRRNDKVFSERVAAACWRYAKSLVIKEQPTNNELKLAEKLIGDDGCGKEIGKFQIAATVLLDDSLIGNEDEAAIDTAIQNAVEQIGNKMINLQS